MGLTKILIWAQFKTRGRQTRHRQITSRTGQSKIRKIEVTDTLIPPPTTSKEEDKATMEETKEEMMKEMTEVEKNTNGKKRNTCYRRRFTSVNWVRKKKTMPDQNILVTATLFKRERTFPKKQTLIYCNLSVRMMIITVKMFY